MEFPSPSLSISALSIVSLSLFAFLSSPHSTPSIDGQFHSSCYLLLITSFPSSYPPLPLLFLPLPLLPPFVVPLFHRGPFSPYASFMQFPRQKHAPASSTFDTAYNYSEIPSAARNPRRLVLKKRKEKKRGSGLSRSTPPITISIVALGQELELTWKSIPQQ